MTLIDFRLEHYDEVVDMYYEFIKEIYPKRKIGAKYFFYRKVSDWINKGYMIVLAVKDDIIVGFTASYVNDMGGITEPVYFAEVGYVKPEFRKSRAAYMLYHNGSNYAKEHNLITTISAFAKTQSASMIEKHFDCEKMFINYERNIK